MKKLKSSLIALLICCICFTLVPSVYAATSLTITDKAKSLDLLSLLSGDGNGDYMLEKPLLRSQAVVLITKLLGKADYVLENRESLSVTKFPDVASNQWYAPYIGYCSSQGIIAGDDKGNFLPNAAISDRAFLKLLIMTLGYDYGTDFTWSNVFKKAYEIGLVTDSSFLTKTKDNNNYKRNDVVSAIYNALTKVNKKTKVTMLQGLINENVISREQAISAGLADSSTIAITQTIVLNQNSIFLKFDKKVENIVVENIKVYETGDTTKKLDASIQATQPDSVVINTATQVAYLDYTIEISNVTVAGSALSNTLSTRFEGYRAAELKSDFFRISKVEPVSNSMVNVYFTHPVNTNSEKASYYIIMEGNDIFAQGYMKELTAKYAGTPNNLVVLSLQGKTFTEGKQYTVKVSGDLTSLYAVKLNEGQEDSLRFAFTGLTGGNTSNTSLAMTKITLLDYKTMQLEFNMEVHPTRAQQIYNYYITDPNGYAVEISKAAVGGSGSQSGKIVYLSLKGTFIKTFNYKIMINEIDDISKQYSINEKEYTFNGNYPERTALNIQSVSAVDKNTISVYFDRPLDPTSAVTKEYYNIVGITQQSFSTIPAKVVFDSNKNPNKVDLFLASNKELASNNTYKLTVFSVMKDNLGNIAGINREATFYGSSTSGAKPYISDAVIISNDTIKVTASRAISLSLQNILTSNYSLEYIDSGTPVSFIPLFVSYIDSTTLVLKFDTLDFNKEYTLKFNSLTDYSELYTRTAADGQTSIKVRLGK